MRKLPPESQLAREELGDMADWGLLAENVARLVDLFTAYLNYEYANWTVDPDEVEAHRKRKVKPPPRPLIQPVAARPSSLHEQMEAAYAEEAVKYQLPDLGQRMVDSDEFDRLLGL